MRFTLASRISLAALLISAALSPFSAPAGAPPPPFPTKFEVIPIPLLPDTEQNWAKSINDSGYVVGFSLDTDPDPDESLPFIFNSGVNSLQPIAIPSQSIIFGEATSINSGNFSAVTTKSNNATPFVGYINLKNFRLRAEPLEPGGDVVMTDINNSFAATGAAVIGGATHATLFYEGNLGDFGAPLGYTNARGYGINEQNIVCGTAWNANPVQTSAFIYSDDFHILQTLGGSWAAAFNINFSKAVGSSYISGDAAFHACSWSDINEPPVGIDPLFGATNSLFIALNDLNDYVGWSESNGSPDHRAVVTPSQSSALLDLNTLIPPASGWVLREAWDINNYRQIVGVGELNGNLRGFLLNPIPALDTIAYYDFTGAGGLQGWTTLTSIPPFASPIIADSPDGLVISPNNQFNAFGLAQSPNVQFSPNVRYRAVFEVSSNFLDPALVPQFRLRVGQQVVNAAWVMNVDSVNAAAPGQGATLRYEFEFTPAPDQSAKDIFMAIDITHFNPFDSNTGIIWLKRAWIEIAYAAPKNA